MGGCMTGAKGDYRDSSIRSSGLHDPTQVSSVEQYVFFRSQSNFKKKSLAEMGHAVSRKQSQRERVTHEPKKQKSIQLYPYYEEKSSPKKLPTDIVDFVRQSKHMLSSRRKQEQQEAERQKEQTTNILVRKSVLKDTQRSGFRQSQHSILSLTTSMLSEKSNVEEIQVMDIITNYGGSSLYESKLEKTLLSSSDFKFKLNQVNFIEKQPAEEFRFQTELGKGSMCKVYRAHSRTDINRQFAVRIMPIQNQAFLMKIKQEIAVMNLCQSHNIIKHNFTYHWNQTLFMFIEYMDLGSLNQFIKKHRGTIEERVIAYIIREILKGLVSIHRKRQLHRDLKSDNIMINQKGDIKIGDFGYALQLTKEKKSCKELAGTPAWMAPQLIKKQDYNESVDIWSLGIILVELCQGAPRYLTMKPLMAMVMIATRPPQTVTGRSKMLQNFLGRCLKKDPSERATVRQLLADPFMGSIGNGAEQKKKYLQMLNSIHHNYT